MGCMHGAGAGDVGCAAKKWWLVLCRAVQVYEH